jgi:hypothetical protein
MSVQAISLTRRVLLFAGLLCLGLMAACSGKKSYKTISGKDYELHYDSRWYLDTLDPDFNPDQYFLISSPDNDAFVSVFLYPRAMNEDDRLEQQLDQHVDQTLTKTRITRKDSWAGIPGKGVVVKGALMGQEDNELMIFVHSDSNRSFQIVTQLFSNDRGRYYPVLQDLETSFRWK